MVRFLSGVPLVSHSNNLAGAVNNALFLVPFVTKNISENFILYCTFTKIRQLPRNIILYMFFTRQEYRTLPDTNMTCKIP